MEDRIEKLARSKKWSELTEDEKQLVLETFGSEVSYVAFQKTNLALKASKKSELLPEPRVISSLKSKFRSQRENPSVFSRFISLKIPAYAVVLLIAVLTFFVRHEPVGKSQVAIQPVVQKDTVYITSAPDTVFVTKVLYRNVCRTQSSVITTTLNNTESLPATSGVGVSMKEKEELDYLLVSGSE